MKNYKAPELEIVKFSHEDVMTVSGEPDVKMNYDESNSNHDFGNSAEYYTLD